MKFRTACRLVTPCCVVLLSLALPGVAAADHDSVERVPPDQIHACLHESRGLFESKRFAFENRCDSPDMNGGCYYYVYRGQELPSGSGFDQRGIESFQVSFPSTEHRWAALIFRDDDGRHFCYSGGAHVGRNPLSMPWGGRPGGKRRKNNFVQVEAGTVKLEGVRVHNTHDTLVAPRRQGGFDVAHSWFSWTRDDFFEGHLQNLRISDTLIDGVYNFLSDPDQSKGCSNASDEVIVIENSLIRVQHQPGPYARSTGKWHWKVEGGHSKLWKLDSCAWNAWPRFVLRDNIFLIEGPSTSNESLNRPWCNLALPGACGRPLERNLASCRNNLFLYSDYSYWREWGLTPGPTPQPGDAFHNPRNPDYLPNGADCYQRVTDDRLDPGYGNVRRLWREARQRWIDRHTGHADRRDSVMRIAGVDHPVFGSSRRLRIRNSASGRCIESAGGGSVSLRTCSNSERQHFRAHPFRDGKLMGAVLLRDFRGAFLRTQPQSHVERDDNGDGLRTRVFAESAPVSDPGFRERWYLLPTRNEPGGERDTYVIESDALGRSFLHGEKERLSIQPLFHDEEQTPLPQPVSPYGNESKLRWVIEKIGVGQAP